MTLGQFDLVLVATAWMLFGVRIDDQRARDVVSHQRALVEWVGGRIGRVAGALPFATGGAARAMRAHRAHLVAPYPDALLDEIADRAPGPEARYEAREAISLAFVTALQLLPPRQRAALILRDVLGFPAAEAAAMLEASEESVTSALKRARATMHSRLDAPAAPIPAATSEAERQLVDRLARAFEAADIDGIVALLTDDVWMRMPPIPLEYQGRDLCHRFYETVAFRDGREYRMVPTRANGQPALAAYVRDPHAAISHANGLIVLTLRGEQISVVTRFDNGVFAHFGLPLTLPD